MDIDITGTGSGGWGGRRGGVAHRWWWAGWCVDKFADQTCRLQLFILHIHVSLTGSWNIWQNIVNAMH